MPHYLDALNIFHHLDVLSVFWLTLGFIGQILFSGRMLVQWVLSEKLRRSIVPVTFWWLSIGGGIFLLIYAIHKRDIVFISGQFFGVIIYARNLWLIYSERKVKHQQSLSVPAK